MIITVFSPSGIVTATSCLDTFFEVKEKEGSSIVTPFKIEGLPHVLTFWDSYALVYKNINQYSYDAFDTLLLSLMANKWNEAPTPMEFMTFLKKIIVDHNLQIFGVVSTYFSENGQSKVPYVYQILGQETRRINIDNNGNINYNCICLEKEPVMGRLLKQIQLRNGDEWEELSGFNLRYDLFSVSKSMDFCKFAIKTDHFINNVATTTYETPIYIDMAVVTPNTIEVLQKKY